MSDEEKVVEVQTPEKPKKEKKPKSKARKIIEWVLFSIFGAACAFVLIATIDGMVRQKQNHGQSIRFGVGSFVIQTDSMEPKMMVGSAIITYKEDVRTFESRLEKGEIIDVTFWNEPVAYSFEPDTEEFKGHQATNLTIPAPMTHRLREVHIDENAQFGKGRYYFVVSGINDQGELSKIGQYQVFTEQQYLGTVKMVSPVLGRVFNFMISIWGLLILLIVPAAYLIVSSSIDIFKAFKQAETEEEKVKEAGDDKLAAISNDDRERLKKELLEQMIKEKQEAKAKKDEKPE